MDGGWPTIDELERVGGKHNDAEQSKSSEYRQKYPKEIDAVSEMQNNIWIKTCKEMGISYHVYKRSDTR
jgi:hypothetical protein